MGEKQKSDESNIRSRLGVDLILSNKTGGANMARDVFAVLSGGGVKGAAFLGALEEAQKYVRFVGWGGASAGSIVAALMACGYQIDELKDRLNAAPYADFFRISKWRLLRFNHFRGMVDPHPLLKWLRMQIGEKFPEHTHINFSHLTGELQYLKIVATNISTQEIMIYSRRTTPTMEIAKAVLASCSYPLLFPPHHDGTFEFVDGGLMSNFPMWLFHDEEEIHKEFTPVIGFSLITRPKRQGERLSTWAHVLSIVNSVLVAQDRVQEKYMDTARLSNVIRIEVDPIPTFSASLTPKQNDALVKAGRDAASNYFTKATMNYGEPVKVDFDKPVIDVSRAMVGRGDYQGAVSLIARAHVLHGGVARDDGLLARRVFVKYYIDLMEAVTEKGKLDVLSDVLAQKIKKLEKFDRIIGIKKGNIILSYDVARKLDKPLSVFKTDMSYKMGQPFDGPVRKGEKVIIVDDFASDASILLNAVRYLHYYHTQVLSIVTLIGRAEGDARDKIMRERGVPVYATCYADDEAIERLLDKSTPFESGDDLSR